MATKVLFVHGTGVRRDSYFSTCDEISRELDRRDSTVKLEPCLWGESFGARLGMDGASIPHFNISMYDGPSDQQLVGLWAQLGRDPLFELRASTNSYEDDDSPGVRIEREKIYDAMKSLRTNSAWRLTNHLQAYLGVADWDAVVSEVSDSKEFKDAVNTTNEAFGALRGAIARAVIATVQHSRVAENRSSLPKSVRDESVKLCHDLLGGTDMGGIPERFEKLVQGALTNFASFLVKRKRNAVFSATVPMAGDIMLYQARGQEIRDFIEKRIVECGKDVIVLAHSLGGIACVELLIEKELPQVKALVTVGSQAPFLYEINALGKLAWRDPLPGFFPKQWLNVYDRNDLLSYCAGEVFKGHAEDLEVHSDLPFPDSHSGYWALSTFWDRFEPLLK